MGFYFDQTRCTGCYTCVVACKDWNDLPPGPVSFLRVTTVERGRFPNLFLAYLFSPCWHCQKPPCLPACPVGAVSKRATDGVVIFDSERCLGKDQCPERCRKACPWDAPQFGTEPGAKMQKCDFCVRRIEEGRLPVCVESCPLFALDAGPLEVLREKYGDLQEAKGFKGRPRFRPSVVFKPKIP